MGEKEQKSYLTINENKIIHEPIKKFEYANDIILINIIKQNNHNNYFSL